MSSDVHIKPSTVTVQQFFLQDGEKSVPAGELLGALMALTDSKKPLQELDVSQEVVDYLKDHDYITMKNNEFDVTNGQRIRCEELGNQVSKIIDDQISQLPEGTEVKLPQILVIHSPGHVEKLEQTEPITE